VCWDGVYNCTRAFLPMLQKADEGHIVNTSSVNDFWASIGPHVTHTAYNAAKFAVKGLTEALITDLRINAPHIRCSVVMPGHIGTSIPLNSRKIQSGNQSDAMDPTQIAQARARIASMGRDVSNLSDEDHRKMVAGARTSLPRGSADECGAGRDHHPRRCQSRPVAHPRRRGRAPARRSGP
jgi:NAD(P)-dependent dehydrogenase (short-subunit alcohol dehydrogenase family)